MDTKDEIRRRRLADLCQREGGVRAVGEKADVNWQALDQVLKGVKLPAQKDGTRSAKALGDVTARKLERVYDLGEGWFDWPFDAVDFKRWSTLNAEQRMFVMGRMESLLDEAERLMRPSPEQQKNKSKSLVKQND